jgi:hypothetical protein
MPGNIDEGGELGPLVSPGASQSKWDIAERIVKMVALVAIPIVVPLAIAYYSAQIQKGAQEQAINRDYVQLAVSLLKEKKNDLDPGLRDWAVDLLAQRSPTKFKPEVITALKNGDVSLPDAAISSITMQLLSPDGRLLARANSLAVQIIDVASEHKIRQFVTPSVVTALDFSQDSLFLAIGTQDGSAMVYSMDAGELRASFRVPPPIRNVRIDPLLQIRIVNPDGVWIYKISTGELVMKPPAPPAQNKTPHSQ